MKTITGGIVAITIPADNKVHNVKYFPWNRAKPTAKVFIWDDEVAVRAHVNSSHPYRKENIAIVAIPGLASGSIIFRNIIQ